MRGDWWRDLAPNSWKRIWLSGGGSEPCRAVKADGSPCTQKAHDAVSVALCGRHISRVERAWQDDVEQTAQRLLRRWVRRRRGETATAGRVKGQRGGCRSPGVYFIEAMHPKYGRLIKIGVASDVGRRLSGLSYHGFLPFLLLAVEPMAHVDAIAREKELHQVFRRARVCGEWFVPVVELTEHVALLRRGGE